jgi:hypothetical protein
VQLITKSIFLDINYLWGMSYPHNSFFDISPSFMIIWIWDTLFDKGVKSIGEILLIINDIALSSLFSVTDDIYLRGGMIIIESEANYVHGCC